MTRENNHISERLPVLDEDAQCPCCEGIFFNEDKSTWKTVENPDTDLFGERVCHDCWDEYQSEFEEAQSHVLKER